MVHGSAGEVKLRQAKRLLKGYKQAPIEAMKKARLLIVDSEKAASVSYLQGIRALSTLQTKRLSLRKPDPKLDERIKQLSANLSLIEARTIELNAIRKKHGL